MSRNSRLAKLGGPLPERYRHTEWSAPDRRPEEEALSLAAPADIVEALGRAMLAERRARLDSVAVSRLVGLTVVLEDLHDPHNGGAALRSCEAVGLSEVHFISSREEFRTSSKITQGCDKWLEIRRHHDAGACFSGLKQRGFRLYAAVPGAKQTLEELDPETPAAFLIGNEHAGLSPIARAACDLEFAIPLHGFSESVNLSVATALIVYTHATRRRKAKGCAGDLDKEALLELTARYYARDVRGAVAIVRHYLDTNRRGYKS